MGRRLRGRSVELRSGPLLVLVLAAACTPVAPTLSPPPSPSPIATVRLPTPVPTVPATPAPTGPSASPSDDVELVVRKISCGDTCGPLAGTVVLSDGRIIWEDVNLVVVESRLTPAGLQQVRDALDATGLLDRSASFQAQLRPGAQPPGHGAMGHSFELGGGPRPIVVDTVDPRSFEDQPNDWIIPPEAQVLTDLADRLGSPVAWLGNDAFADPIRPYQPVGYVLVVDLFPTFGDEGFEVDVDDVDWPFAVPIETTGEAIATQPDEPPVRCLLLDEEASAATLAAEAATGAARDLRNWLSTVEYGWRRADGFVQVSLLPLLPYQSGTCRELAAPILAVAGG